KSLHITALKVVRATSESAARRLADDTIVELNRDGSRYEIQVRYPHSSSHINLWESMGELTIPRIEVRLALEVPSGVAVELDGASADLDGEGLSAPLPLHSASGDADLRRCVGDIQVSTASGDVTIEGSRAASVTTVSGDIHVSVTRGPLQIRTGSGDVAIGDLGDSLAI